MVWKLPVIFERYAVPNERVLAEGAV